MPYDMRPGDWVIVGIAAVVVTAAIIIGAIRALWTYNAAPWLRRALLTCGVLGAAAGIAGVLRHSELLVIGGLALSIGPFGIWWVIRSISYSGPPPGLLKGPKALDTADDIVDSISRAVTPRRDPADRDET
jgi:hypothetical protein